MLTSFINFFVGSDKNPADYRKACGSFAGFFGIFTNILLFVMKVFIGVISGSISIIADAVNNLGDFASSIFTVIGFKLASKPADEEHPFGHARIEYLTGLGISLLVILIGFEFFKSSVEKILSPTLPSFSVITYAILIISVIIKLFQGLVYKKIGQMINSQPLIASFTDSFSDVISTLAVLIGAVVSSLFDISIDGYIGIAVSAFIMYSGIKLVLESVNTLIGTAPDVDFVDKLVEELSGYPITLGVHDLEIHSYGADKSFASVHLEIDANSDILEAHDTIDTIEREIYEKFGTYLVIHADPIVTDSPELTKIKNKVIEILRDISSDISMHDFRAVFGITHTNLIFDICIPYSFELSEAAAKALISSKIKQLNPEFNAVISVDRDFRRKKV